MKLLAAGYVGKHYIQYIKQYNLSKLYSFFHEKKHIDKYVNGDFNLMMVDSGAHSWNKLHFNACSGIKASANLPDINEFHKGYINYIKANKNKEVVFVELDAYSYLTEKYLTEVWQELQAIPNHKYEYIRVYHPVLDNGSLKILDRWILEKHKYIGIGNDSTHLLDPIFSRTRDKIKIHGFAMTKRNLLEKYPFYSADSTTPIASDMFGCIFDSNMKTLHKTVLYKKRRFELIYIEDKKKRLEISVKNFKKLENYLTNLWEHRGIKWD